MPDLTAPDAAHNSTVQSQQGELKFKVLGRTLEHLGVQMYKRRDVAIAELVANCWDAGATSVFITVADDGNYNLATSKVTLRDTGCGMSFNDVQDAYLVLGRNRRKTGGQEVDATASPLKVEGSGTESVPHVGKTRRVMGRKGIGKLAGFGIAQKMTVTTWQADKGIEFYLDLAELKASDNDSADVPIRWQPIPPKTEFSSSGTLITLETLKHKTPIDVQNLRISLARRFSRTVKGEMEIKVNDYGLPDPTPPCDKRIPEQQGAYHEHTLPAGNKLKYWYAFASDPVHLTEQRGFVIMVHGKVAQAPPFFFNVEAKASGQHATRYLIGEIEADFIDDGTDDESDLVSTDRQEIDWEDTKVEELKTWGEKFTRSKLIECVEFRGEKTEKEVFSNDDIKQRVERLDKPSQKQIKSFLKILGNRENDDGKTLDLADGLVRAYEFRQFHDVTSDIQKASDDPNKLAHLLMQLSDWKVLESRAILEIIKGRLGILDKFHDMLCNDVPETKSSQSVDNMHDLLAGNPWLLNPEWQLLTEEKKITTQLKEWGQKDLPDYKGRYDFLGLGSDRSLVVIEIKRPNYAAELYELQKLQEYQNRLSLAQTRPIKMLFICGRELKVNDRLRKTIESDDFEIRNWSTLFDITRRTYEHYRAVLDGTIRDPSFHVKEEEVVRTRALLDKGMHRNPETRKEGIPSSDVLHETATAVRETAVVVKPPLKEVVQDEPEPTDSTVT